MDYFLYEQGTEKGLGRLTNPMNTMRVGGNIRFAKKNWLVVSVQPNVGLPNQSTVMVNEIEQKGPQLPPSQNTQSPSIR